MAGWVERKLGSTQVLETLTELFLRRGPPQHIRSDNGSEFCADAPWENGYIESFNGKLRDEFLNGEIFTSLKEAQVLITHWREHYNCIRPHSSLSYRPPAPEAWLIPLNPTTLDPLMT